MRKIIETVTDQHGLPRHLDVTRETKNALQTKLYEPCFCGSGRKAKFCQTEHILEHKARLKAAHASAPSQEQ